MDMMRRFSLALLCLLALTAPLVMAGPDEAVLVNVDNFNRAQTDFEFAGIIKLAGGINKLHSNRTPTPIDKQNVIRMNRDTLYSLGVVDISKGATVTLPDAGKRYMSLMVINNDGYVNRVYYESGAHELTVANSTRPPSASWFERWRIPRTRRIWRKPTSFRTGSGSLRAPTAHS